MKKTYRNCSLNIHCVTEQSSTSIRHKDEEVDDSGVKGNKVSVEKNDGTGNAQPK